MKLVPVYANFYHISEPIEYRFKKHKVRGSIQKEKETGLYFYSLQHPDLQKVQYGFDSVESAKEAAESYINTWSIVQGRLLALKY